MNKTKKVFIVNHNELDSLVLGYNGRVQTLAEVLGQRDISYEILTNDVGHMEKVKPKIKDIPGYKIFTTHQYKKNVSMGRMLTNCQFAVKVFFYLRKNICHNSVVVANTIPPEVIAAISLLRRFKKFELLADGRDFWPYAFSTSNPTVVNQMWASWANLMMKIACKKIDKALVVAEQYSPILRGYGYGGQITYLPLGFDNKRWNVEQSNMSGEWGDTPNCLVYIGNQNNQFDLPSCLKLLDGKFRKICVIGNHWDKVTLDNSVVDYVGVKSASEIIPYVEEADFGLLPPLDKSGIGVPNKLFDYLGAKLPLLVFGNDEAANFVAEKRIGLRFENLNEASDCYDELIENVLVVRQTLSRQYLYQQYVEKILE